MLVREPKEREPETAVKNSVDTHHPRTPWFSAKITSFSAKRLLRLLAYIIFVIIMSFLTLVVSFRIALKNVRATEHHIDLGNKYMFQGKFEESLVQFDEALELNPRRKIALAGKGLSLLYLGRYEEALSAYNSALKLDHTYLPAIEGKGLSLDKLARYDEGVQFCDEALKYYPGNKRFLAIRDSFRKKWNAVR